MKKVKKYKEPLDSNIAVEDELIAYQRSLFEPEISEEHSAKITQDVDTKKYTFIDLFAGCGGLSDGFLQTGKFEGLAHVEWEKPMCDTLSKRLFTKWGHKNSSNEVIRFDIQRTDELLNGFEDSTFGCHLGLNSIIKGKVVDTIIGGPPCQAYSLAGRIRDEHGMRNDYRNFLFESYIKVVKYFNPKFFVFENVLGLLSAAPTGVPIVDIIRDEFKKSGYIIIPNLRNAVFDVADFGVPQHRKRVIILGVNSNLFNGNKNDIEDVIYKFYSLINLFKVKKQRTVDEAIGDLPPFYPLYTIEDNNKRTKVSHSPSNYSNILNHEPRYHNTRDIEIFRMLADDIASGRNEYISTKKLKELYTIKTGKESNIHKYYVLRKNEPSNTIPAHLFKDGMRHIHPDPSQARSITVREAARLQSFDDDFEFLGGRMYQYKMIGNAVPPLFAKVIANSLYFLLRHYNTND